jgi:hypothetical protein
VYYMDLINHIGKKRQLSHSCNNSESWKRREIRTYFEENFCKVMNLKIREKYQRITLRWMMVEK